MPAPPPPKTVTGPHGREHRLHFRLRRTPGGISAEAIEQVPAGEHDDGYALTVFGDHDADPALLLAELDQHVLAETSRCYLEHDDELGWQATGAQVAGRFAAARMTCPTSSSMGAASPGWSSAERWPLSRAGGSGWASVTTFRSRPQHHGREARRRGEPGDLIQATSAWSLAARSGGSRQSRSGGTWTTGGIRSRGHGTDLRDEVGSSACAGFAGASPRGGTLWRVRT